MPFALNESTQVHQPDQDARVHGGREADRQHADHGRGRALRRHRAISAARRRSSSPPASARWQRPRRNARTRRRRCATCLAHTSWDTTAARMDELIAEAVDQRPLRAKPVHGPPEATPADGAARTDRHRRRARPGLSAAYHLGEDALLIEQNDRVGGWCRSIEDRWLHVRLRRPHHVLERPLRASRCTRCCSGDNVHWQDREAWIYSKNVYTRYPFQGALTACRRR